MNKINFYSVIIGTELLNGRRKDAHFAFLNEQLLKRGWEHKASFVIEDDPKLMRDVFNLIKADENSVMFCFGGIGATPDDCTREVAAQVFTDSKMEFHKEAKRLIVEQFKKEAYPHRVNMAHFPVNANLLQNPVNKVAGFYLQDRFFFTPGFPSMSQSMVVEALDKFYLESVRNKYRRTLTITCAENDLIEVMQEVPSELQLSSLPKFEGELKKVVISLSNYEESLVEKYLQLFIVFCEQKKMEYVLEDAFTS